MKRRFTAIFTAALICAAAACPSYAATIKVDGMMPSTDMDSITADGVEMINADVLFDYVEAKHSYNKYKKVYTASKGTTSVVINLEAGTAELTKPNDDGVEETSNLVMPSKPYVVEENADDSGNDVITKVYVPLKAVGEAFGMSVKWNSETKSIDVKTNRDNGYILLDTNSDVVDENTRVLTYEEALELAKNKSSDLKSLDDSEYYLKSLRSDLSDSIFQINSYESVIDNQIVGLNEKIENSDGELQLTLREQLVAAQQTMQSSMESFVTVARNIKKVELQQSMMDVNKEMAADGIELTLMNYLTQMRNTETQISVLEDSVALGQENIKNLELKNSLGYESDTDLASAKTNQSASEAALEELKLSLENAKQNLKTFLGIKSDESVYIEYDPESSTFFDELNLNSFVTKKKEGDPSIRILKNNVTMNKYIVRTNIVYESENRTGVQNDLMTAQRALSDAQDSMEKKIRNAYNNILQLREMKKTYKQDIDQAVADYNKVLVSYQTGFATEYQVKQAKLGVINAEKNYDDNELNRAMMEFQLEHPYLLS
jgi:hypothetical protein